MLPISLLLTVPARAGVTSVTADAAYPAPPPDSLVLDASCPRGTELIGGGGGLNDYNPTYQAASLTGTGTGYHAAWHRVSGTPTPTHDADLFAAVVCTDDPGCLDRLVLSTAVDGTDDKSLTVLCPAGTFAVGGGFTVTGDPSGIEVYRSSAVGLLAPIGWRVRARELTPVRSWGLQVEARCVQPSVMDEVTPLAPNFGGEALILNGPSFGYTWLAVARVRWAHFLADGWLLSVGGRTLDAGGLVTLGPGSDYLDSVNYWGLATNVFLGSAEGSVDTAGEMAMYAADPKVLGYALDACDPTLEVPELPYFEIGAEVMFGLIGCGGGMIWLPGTGPVPVDPEPFRTAFDALPAAVVGYDDPRELDAVLSEVEAGLDAERTGWIELDDPAGTLEDPFGGDTGVVLVVPRDEAAAVEWMSAHRDEIARQAHVTILALEAGGRGFEALNAW